MFPPDPDPVPPPPWWHRRGPSALVFAGVLVIMGLAAALLWSEVNEVLPDLGKDRQGEDPWTDPVGVERVAGFQVVRIPDCAVAPVVRIGMWDEQSNPYWEVAGPATPMSSFAVGATPEGFEEITPYTAPPGDAVLRLVVVRKLKGVAGVRFEDSQLKPGYVVSGPPLSRYPVEDFQTGDVCGDEGTDATTTSTTVGG